MKNSADDHLLAVEATRVYEASGRVLSLRGIYYQLVKEGVLLNLQDEWVRLFQAVQAAPVGLYFAWKPLQVGARWREPDVS